MSDTADLEGVRRGTAPGAELTPIERAAVAAVDTDALVGLVVDLVSLRSLGGDETPAQRRMAAELASVGMEVDVWELDLPALARHPDFSCEVERTEGLGVVGHFGGGGPSLMLNGHIDVVPVGDASQWSTPPWEPVVRDSLIYGRGTVDMKGGLACAVAAVAAVRAAGVALDGSVLIASVIGEEDGGTGTLATLLRGHTADAAVVVEPTAGVIAPSQAGAIGFRLTVPGVPAHGALRTEGVSALEKLWPLHRALTDLEERRNRRFTDPLYAHLPLPIPLSIGTVRAGEWSSTVPDRLVAEGRYGVAPAEDVADARCELEEALAAAAAGDPWLADHPPTLEWWGGQFHPGATDPGHPLVTALRTCHRTVAGDEAPVRGVPYGTDLRHLVNLGGIPSVLYGPGDPRLAHAPDEHVPIAELARVAQTLALLIVRMCSGEGWSARRG